MFLAAEAEHFSMGPIFGIFFGFWAVVLILLWFGTGILTRKQDELTRKAHSKHEDPH